MPAQLISIDEGMRILLDKPILLLGRDSECDIQFESRKISRRHCCIAQVGDRLIVRDLGSTNGVRINGVRVVEGYLRDGDELSVGSHRYRVSGDVLASAPKRAGERERPAEPPRSDDWLDSTDVPVPISESGRPPAARKKKRRTSESAEETRAAGPASDLIPDHLQLAPGSDLSLPSPPAPPPNT
jgi:predicted component of type VI protein secretion system